MFELVFIVVIMCCLLACWVLLHLIWRDAGICRHIPAVSGLKCLSWELAQSSVFPPALLLSLQSLHAPQSARILLFTLLPFRLFILSYLPLWRVQCLHNELNLHWEVVFIPHPHILSHILSWLPPVFLCSLCPPFNLTHSFRSIFISPSLHEPLSLSPVPCAISAPVMNVMIGFRHRQSWEKWAQSRGFRFSSSPCLFFFLFFSWGVSLFLTSAPHTLVRFIVSSFICRNGYMTISFFCVCMCAP